jgi:S1-C subfamily serine protease
LRNALQGALSSISQSVALVDDPSAVQADQLLTTYDADYKELSRNDWSGRLLFRSTLWVRFQDSTSKRLIAEISHAENVEYSPSAATTAASVLTGGSLFLLSPITVPLTTLSIGEEAKRLLERTIGNAAGAVAQSALTDSRLVGWAQAMRRGPTDPVAAVDRSRPLPPSKYEDFLRCVVLVRSSSGIGSAFFTGPAGILLTNHHVVGSDKSVSIRLRDGSVLTATVLATEPHLDLALLSVQQDSPSWLELAREGEGGIGSEVLAIGVPEGLAWTLTKGIVSGIRDLDDARFVQTDAPINKGNSGGPLILAESGRVVGVNTFGLRKVVAEGISFAVSADTVRAAFPRHFQKPK